MIDPNSLPLLRHPLDQPSAFTPEQLMDSVRGLRGLPSQPLPPLCILEFDGDLTDWLIQQSLVHEEPHWACFHTRMFAAEFAGLRTGIIPRTIGGPYAVLIAEQLAAAGVRLIVGLTSAGRVSPALPLPCLLIADRAVRDEGTSLHYLPPSESVDSPVPDLLPLLARELPAAGRAVHTGPVWTTDAPYRETAAQLQHWSAAGILAVEMQAASLFAFAHARKTPAAVVAMVSNAVDHPGEQFDTGTPDFGLRVLEAIARAAQAWLSPA